MPLLDFCPLSQVDEFALVDDVQQGDHVRHIEPAEMPGRLELRLPAPKLGYLANPAQSLFWFRILIIPNHMVLVSAFPASAFRT